MGRLIGCFDLMPSRGEFRWKGVGSGGRGGGLSPVTLAEVSKCEQYVLFVLRRDGCFFCLYPRRTKGSFLRRTLLMGLRRCAGPSVLSTAAALKERLSPPPERQTKSNSQTQNSSLSEGRPRHKVLPTCHDWAILYPTSPPPNNAKGIYMWAKRKRYWFRNIKCWPGKWTSY